MYGSARSILAEVSELLRPPRRMLPSEACSKYLRNDKGAWSLELVPMLREPLDMLGSRDYRGIVFVGPQRTGKTFTLVDGAICYAVTCTSADTLVVGLSQDWARDYSRTEIDRIIRHSPELAARLSPRPRDDNVTDKTFRSGAMLKIAWPTVTNLAGRTVQTVLLPDYDRPENRDDVDSEGPLWDLAYKRIETFMSRGKCLAESSPGDEYTADWHPTTPHEAPPARGILSIYNSGTRARWYWRCVHCSERFEAAPGVGVFGLPSFDELVELVQRTDLRTLVDQYARIACPHCGVVHEMADKQQLNASGVWLHEGERFEGDRIVGARRRTSIASYWLGGCAAAFQRWDALLERYFAAIATFARLGDESPLKAATTMDLGTAYLPRAALRRHTGAALRKRAESWPKATVPEGVRFLTQAVDTQSNRFVVQVHGYGVGLESWIVDRYALSDVDPAAVIEDWDGLQRAIRREYALQSNPDVRLPVLLTLVDSGGAEGTTTRAYEFWRRMRAVGLGRRVLLVKGTGSPNAPRVRRVWPDSSGRSDRPQGGQGDVPVLLVNTNMLKDAVANDLARERPGPGFTHFGDWLDGDFYDELTAEQRTPKGWRGRSGVRNEALDLSVYARAAAIVLRAERIDWSRPPSWAANPAERAKPKPDPPPSERLPARNNFHRPRRNWVTDWRQ